MSLKLFLFLILTGLLVAFIVQNSQVTELRFLVWTVALSQAVMLFLTLVIGVLMGWIAHAYLAHKRARRRAAAERESSRMPE